MPPGDQQLTYRHLIQSWVPCDSLDFMFSFIMMLIKIVLHP